MDDYKIVGGRIEMLCFDCSSIRDQVFKFPEPVKTIEQFVDAAFNFELTAQMAHLFMHAVGGGDIPSVSAIARPIYR